MDITLGNIALYAFDKAPDRTLSLYTHLHSLEMSHIEFCKNQTETPGGNALTNVVVQAMQQAMQQTEKLTD